MADVTLTPAQQCPFTLEGLTAAGTPASFAADTLTVASDYPDIVAASIMADGTGLVVAQGPVGSALVTVTDTRPDGGALTHQFTVAVAETPSDEAVTLSVTFGTPEPKV